jgi:predicted nucleic acid-binding protein
MPLINTCIIIDHLRTQRKHSYLALLDSSHSIETMYISMLTIQELFQGSSTLIESKRKDLLGLIAPLRILPYTFEIAQLAGEIARDSQNPIQFTDAGLAATSIMHAQPLATLNTSDFIQIPNLELYSLESLQNPIHQNNQRIV